MDDIVRLEEAEALRGLTDVLRENRQAVTEQVGEQLPALVEGAVPPLVADLYAANPPKPGVDGIDGKDGTDGVDGIDGKDGTDGVDGIDGKDGTDGVGPDEKVKLDAADPEAGFLEDKLQPGLNVSFRRSKDGKALVIDSKGGGTSVSVQGPGGGGGAGPPGPAGPGVPTGGTTDQVLTKASNADLDTEWRDPTAGPDTDDQTAAEVPFTPAAGLVSTNVQAAIEEVAAEVGSGLQDIEAVLTQGDDAGGQEITNLGGVKGASNGTDTPELDLADGNAAIEGADNASGTGGAVYAYAANPAGFGAIAGNVQVQGGQGAAGYGGGSVIFSAGQGNDGATLAPELQLTGGNAAGSIPGQMTVQLPKPDNSGYDFGALGKVLGSDGSLGGLAWFDLLTAFGSLLPTTDPAISGSLWNNLGVVMVSAG